MNKLSRTITGIVMVVFGIFLLTMTTYGQFTPLILGIPIILVGLYILFNRHEDEIEQRKDLKN